MECGNMKNLSGALYGRDTGPNGTFRNRPSSPLVSSLATPRGRKTSSSSHATPRGRGGTTPRDSHLTPRGSMEALKTPGVRYGLGGLKSPVGGECGLEGEEFGGIIARRSPCPTPRGATRASKTQGVGCRLGGLKSPAGLVAEEFGGSIPPRSPCPSDRPLSPHTRQSPRVTRRLTMASRDKESLLEEIIQLKKTLAHQASIIRVKNVQNSRFGIHNRKLEMDVEDLETSLQLEGPRTGSPSRLRSKLVGLETMVEELQDKCDVQHREIMKLRRDLRVTRTREIEVERDVFAGEIKRLQKLLRRMQTMQNRINCENRDLGRLKNKFQQLEIANIRLESCMTAKAIRPQSQPGTSRKNVHYDQDGHQMNIGRPHSEEKLLGNRDTKHDTMHLQKFGSQVCGGNAKNDCAAKFQV